MKQKLRPLEVFMNLLFFVCGLIAVVFVLFISIYLIVSGLPAIRGAHGATAHNARSHGKCACYPTENAHAIRRENAHAIRRENAHAIHVKMRMLSDVD